MPALLNMTEVEEILASGEFDKLVGTIEHETLDGKSGIYVTTDPLGKVELTKDIAAFANSSGGYILIGVQTKENPQHKGEDIISVSPVKQDVCNWDSWKDIVNQHIYPSLGQHLRIKWHASRQDPSKGIIAIRVSPDCESGFPYLIDHVGVGLSQGIATGKLFGFYQRIEDDSKAMRIEELRELLKRGMDSADILTKLTDIQITLATSKMEKPAPSSSEAETKLPTTEEPPIPPIAKPGIDATEIGKRLGELRRAVGLESTPAIALGAFPSNSIEFERLFDSRISQEARLIEHPPVFRQSGFDLNTHGQSEIIQGTRLRCIAKNRKAVELWKDGALLFIGRGDDSFLGWAVGQYSKSTLLINNLALTEVVTLFFRLCEQAYKLAIPAPNKLVVQLTLTSDAPTPPNYELGTNVSNSYFIEPHGGIAPTPSGKFETTTEFENMDVYAEAFKLLSKVYNWFGYRNSDIPYQELDDLLNDPLNPPKNQIRRINKRWFEPKN